MDVKREEQMDAMLDEYVMDNPTYSNAEQTIAKLVWDAFQAGWEAADSTPKNAPVPKNTVKITRRRKTPQS